MDGRDSAADDYQGEARDFAGGMQQLTCRTDVALDSTYERTHACVLAGSDDPLHLVWDRGGATGQPEVSSSLPSLSSSSSVAIPERALPPSEDVMAAWLYPIVSGHQEDPAVDSVPMAMEMIVTTAAGSSKGKLPATDVMCKDPDSMEKQKAAAGGSSSRHGSATPHNITEKRRRSKIAQRFRTLQQLVPGCDHKSNQATTLDRTVRYMRWLQQQVQSMGMTAPPAAAYPVVQIPPAAAVAMSMPPATTFPPGVVPFGAMLSYPHYHALMMPVAAPAAPLYPPAQAGASAADPDATGEHVQCSVTTEPQQHQHEEEGRDCD